MASSIKSYRDLEVWCRAKLWAVSVYRITKRFPREELYGLTSQIRRAAVSIPSNIAEGFRRNSGADKVHFLRIAYGSGAELETQLEICKDLGFLGIKDYNELSDELDRIMRMLNRAIATLLKNT